MHHHSTHRFDTIVIGAGQAGLAIGHFLARQRREFIILDAAQRIGATWRNRWDTLRLFTPASHSALPGLRMPTPGRHFPSKDETADYLESYARHFDLPVALGQHVDSLSRHDTGYAITAGAEEYLAERVVVATGPYHHPNIPDFAIDLAPTITQLHSSAYRNPGQLPDGDALVVGAGNSGAEIAVELAPNRRTYLAGRDTGSVPLRLIHNRFALWLAEHLTTVDTRLGQLARVAEQRRGAPLVRLNHGDVVAAGVERVPRVADVIHGYPRLDDGRILDVAVVVWATGYQPDYQWIQLPIFDGDGHPIHHRGVVPNAPGLYFLGLQFQSSPTSAHVGGVGNDARYLAGHLATTQPGRAVAQPGRQVVRG
jgi:putative flavoprotein involved in K+ transport